MKTNTQRAMERLTLTPNEEFLLKKDGFIGALYKPDKDEYPGKAVIMFGGSAVFIPSQDLWRRSMSSGV